MLPGGIGQMMAGMGGNDADTAAQMRKLICIADAMTNEELDSDGKLFEAHPPRPEGAKDLVQGQGREPNQRVLRVARGSGTSVDMVEQFLAQHRMFVGVAKRMVRRPSMSSSAHADRQAGRQGRIVRLLARRSRMQSDPRSTGRTR
jgi:signal recognition particle subunit SRP54